jgi:hypothetical protein
VAFRGSDYVGIRRAEIVDVTEAANPRVVATEDYAATQTAQKPAATSRAREPAPT